MDANKAKGATEIKEVNFSHLQKPLPFARRLLMPSFPRSCQTLERISSHFKENPNAEYFVGSFAVAASSLKMVVGKAIKEVNKPLFLFNVDPEVPAKVAYANSIPKETLKTIDGKTWAAPVGEILGGKGGGKPDSFSGVGSEIAKVDEAVRAAESTFRKVVLGEQ